MKSLFLSFFRLFDSTPQHSGATTSEALANDRADAGATDLIAFANQAPAALPANGETSSWVLLAPYGDHAHSKGVQRFRKEHAQAICNQFSGLLNLPRHMLGLPWYVGHPDHPAFANEYKDKSSYARVKQLAARDDGLYGLAHWNDKGLKVLQNEEYSGHSVNWYCRPVPGTRPQVWEPHTLKSVGFTNTPNLDVPPPSRSLTRSAVMANERAKLRSRMLANRGTSDSARKGWETRRKNGWTPKTKAGAAVQAMAADRAKGNKPLGLRERARLAKENRSAAAKKQYEARVADTDQKHEARKAKLARLVARSEELAKKHYGEGERGGRNHDRAQKAKKELAASTPKKDDLSDFRLDPSKSLAELRADHAVKRYGKPRLATAKETQEADDDGTFMHVTERQRTSGEGKAPGKVKVLRHGKGSGQEPLYRFPKAVPKGSVFHGFKTHLHAAR